MVTQIMLRTHEGTLGFSNKKIRFVTALDLIKCLNQAKYKILLLMCGPFFDLPSNISTIGPIVDLHFLSFLLFFYTFSCFPSLFTSISKKSTIVQLGPAYVPFVLVCYTLTHACPLIIVIQS